MGDQEKVIPLRRGDRAVKGFVDETGEAVTSFLPDRRGRKRKARQKQMSMVDVGVMAQLEMSVPEARVFWRIMSHIPPRSGSVSYCTVKQLSEETGMHRVDVSKQMRALRDRRIIHTIRPGQHHVNTWIAYSGSFDDWNATDGTEMEPIWHRHGVDPVTGEVL